MRIPIRCCCTPRLVLGTVEVWDTLEDGDLVPLRERMSVKLVEPEPLGPSDHVVLTAAVYHELGDGWTPEMRDAYQGTGQRCAEWREQLALRSDDVSIERLRRVAGFVEINRPMRIDEL